jgi:hypothetical protein
MSVRDLTVEAEATSDEHRRSAAPARLAAAAGAALAVAAVPLCTLSGESGAAVTEHLQAHVARLEAGAYLATVAAALLVPAAVLLGRGVPGIAGRVLVGAGVATAVTTGWYYAAFGAAAATVNASLSDPGPGLGEAAQLLVNVADWGRYAPSLALVAAAVVARRHLSRAVWVPAALLSVLTVVPVTTWAAAILIPVWLGLSAVSRSRREPSR